MSIAISSVLYHCSACFAMALRRAAKFASRVHHGMWPHLGEVIWLSSAEGWRLQEFTLTSKFKEESVDQEVAASYKAAKYAIKASVSPAGKVTSSLLLSDHTSTIGPHAGAAACVLLMSAAPAFTVAQLRGDRSLPCHCTMLSGTGSRCARRGTCAYFIQTTVVLSHTAASWLLKLHHVECYASMQLAPAFLGQFPGARADAGVLHVTSTWGFGGAHGAGEAVYRPSAKGVAIGRARGCS